MRKGTIWVPFRPMKCIASVSTCAGAFLRYRRVANAMWNHVLTRQTADPAKVPGRIGRPSPEEAALIQGRILIATWNLLLDGEDPTLSLERIARSAGISKKTIYTRFVDRADLLSTLVRTRLTVEEAWIFSGLDTPSFREAFCNVGDRIIGFLVSPERQAIQRVLLELPEARPMVWDMSYDVGLRSLDALFSHPSAGRYPLLSDATTAKHVILQCLIGHAERLLRTSHASDRTLKGCVADIADTMQIRDV